VQEFDEIVFGTILITNFNQSNLGESDEFK